MRLEIESALRREMPVIPVLVGQARMPPARKLPRSIRQLAFQQAAEVRAGRDYYEHVGNLVKTIGEYLRNDE